MSLGQYSGENKILNAFTIKLDRGLSQRDDVNQVANLAWKIVDVFHENS